MGFKIDEPFNLSTNYTHISETNPVKKSQKTSARFDSDTKKNRFFTKKKMEHSIIKNDMRK